MTFLKNLKICIVIDYYLVFDIPKFQSSMTINVGEGIFLCKILKNEDQHKVYAFSLKIDRKCRVFFKNLKIGTVMDCYFVFNLPKFQVSMTINLGVMNF